MDLLTDLEALLVVVAVSALAPVIAALIPGQRVPQVVILILGGILVGSRSSWLGRGSVGRTDRQRRSGLRLPAGRFRDRAPPDGGSSPVDWR